jgi:hypothetical protein
VSTTARLTWLASTNASSTARWTRRYSRWHGNGSLNFDGTAIDNIGGSLHFDGTEDGVEDGSLDSDEGKLDGSLDSDGTADGTCEGSLFFDG